MIKELERFVEHKYNILTKFKEYLKDESIPIEERWYTFKLHGNLLGPISLESNEFWHIYKKYKLRDFYTIRENIFDDKTMDFVEIVRVYGYYAAGNELLQLKNELMKLGAWNVIY